MVEVLTTQVFDGWIRKLKDRQRLRIVERIDRLAHGNPGDTKPVGQGVWELRLTHGPGYRVTTCKTATTWSSCCAAATSRPSKQTSTGHTPTRPQWHLEENADGHQG